jgi:hypothetical protein
MQIAITAGCSQSIAATSVTAIKVKAWFCLRYIVSQICMFVEEAFVDYLLIFTHHAPLV